MNGMALIIAAALVMGLGGLVVLLWAISNGQYEDVDGAAARILLDDPARDETKSEKI
jgi:cbb3-type cytochrome oxidase maturation protein